MKCGGFVFFRHGQEPYISIGQRQDVWRGIQHLHALQPTQLLPNNILVPKLTLFINIIRNEKLLFVPLFLEKLMCQALLYGNVQVLTIVSR
jgi:hypothetical protein